MKPSDNLYQALNQCYFEEQSTIFEMLSSKQGLDQFTYMVKNLQEKTQDECIKTVPTPVNRQVRSSQSKSQFQNIVIQRSILDEPNQIQLDFQQFMNLMDEYLQDINEAYIMDWFQLIQVNEKVLIRDLYVIILLLISRFCNQQQEYLYQYGELLYQCLKQNNNKILGLGFRMFCKQIGINARTCQEYFNQLKIKNNEEYTFEEFEIFCFYIFSPESQLQQFQNKHQKQYSSNRSEGSILNKYKSDKKLI